MMVNSHMRLQRVIVYARQHRANQNVNETLDRLAEYLHEQSITAVMDASTAASFQLNLPVLPQSEMGAPGDVIVVVGGDGSLLSAARLAIQVNVPVIGINRGQLGFLTDISPNLLEEELGAMLAGKYQSESRFLLQVGLDQGVDDLASFQSQALNDMVLSRGTETHLINFDVHINGAFVSQYRSDGLIVATPTGSTAYALSAGGPILHPELNALVIVPMFSHSLSSRPLVIDAAATVEVFMSMRNEHELQLSCDGHDSCVVQPGQRITIKKHPRSVCLLHPIEHRYYDTLRIKLGWGSHG